MACVIGTFFPPVSRGVVFFLLSRFYSFTFFFHSSFFNRVILLFSLLFKKSRIFHPIVKISFVCKSYSFLLLFIGAATLARIRIRLLEKVSRLFLFPLLFFISFAFFWVLSPLPMSSFASNLSFSTLISAFLVAFLVAFLSDASLASFFSSFSAFFYASFSNFSNLSN